MAGSYHGSCTCSLNRRTANDDNNNNNTGIIRDSACVYQIQATGDYSDVLVAGGGGGGHAMVLVRPLNLRPPRSNKQQQ